jgi:predicted nucleic acid-binding protein
LATPSDQYHRRAYTEIQKLERDQLTVMAPYPTLFETYSLLLRRLLSERAHEWLRVTMQQVGTLAPEARDYDSAIRKVMSYQDQKLSLYDGLLAVLSERLELSIWTFDADFDVMGAEVWR